MQYFSLFQRIPHIPIERYNVKEEGNTQTKNEEQCTRKLTSVFIPKCHICSILCALGTDNEASPEAGRTVYFVTIPAVTDTRVGAHGR
jgi:hypothetical protein